MKKREKIGFNEASYLDPSLYQGLTREVETGMVKIKRHILTMPLAAG